MMKQVVLSPTAQDKLSKLLIYFEERWSDKVKMEFISKLDKSVKRIARFPDSCPNSKTVKGLHQCVVTKQTSLFYRVKLDTIEVITIFDTRQSPRKLKGVK